MENGTRSQWNKWIACVLMAAVLTGLTSAAFAGSITLFAAASLTNALQDIVGQYQKNKDIKIVVSYAASSGLARQIAQGAPADLFISADQQWMNYLNNKQLIVASSRYILLGNSLVLIAPKDSPITQVIIDRDTNWPELLASGRLAMGDPDHVPAGIYAKESLVYFGSWLALKSKIAPANNVRAAMALVGRGEASLGIVYRTDASLSEKVKVVGTFPQDSYKLIQYPIAMVKDGTNTDVSAFYHYLKGPEAAEIFKHYGFTSHNGSSQN